MRDCKLIVTVRDDKVNFEGQDISVEELAQIAGFLQVFVGMEGLKRGLDMDDVKNNMLDIHLAAMETLEEQLRAGKLELILITPSSLRKMSLLVHSSVRWHSLMRMEMWWRSLISLQKVRMRQR